jgi:branched-chain amino acid transport system substrate-binding protein
MKTFFSALLIATLLTLSACGGSGGSVKSPWERTAQTPVAAENPDSLEIRNQWLNKTTPPTQESLTVYPNTQSPVDAQGAPLVPPPLSGKQVKVALLVPLSGSHAEVGEAIVNAAQLALFDVGASTFELLPRDTKGTASGAYAAAESAIAEGAQLILGPLLAEEVRSVSPVASAANINVIAFTTDWKQASNNTYIMGFVPFGQVQRVVTYAATKGLRNIGVIAPQSEYGNAVLSAYNAYAPQSGIQTVDVVRFRSGDAGLSSIIQKFARFDTRKQPDGSFSPAPFDAVFLPAGGSDAHNIGNLLSYYELDTKSVRRLGTGLWDDGSMARETNLNGGWFAAPDPRARATFDGKYRDAYGMTPPRLASLGYDATALAAVLARTGIQRSGSPAFDRAAIANPNGFAGIDGIFRFRSDGLAERGLAILEIRNGTTVVVDPAPRTFQGSVTQ